MEGSPHSAEVDEVALGTVPSQKRGILARERIFEAAMSEFETRGVQGSRVENIVAEAGTSWGTFFRYFPRKEDVLLFGAARHFARYVRPACESAMADPERSIPSVAHEVFAELTEPRYEPRLHAAMIDETVRHPARFAAILDQGDLPIIELFSGLILEGQRRKEIRPEVDPFEAAVVTVAGVMFSTTRVLGAVADGHLPSSEIGRVAGRALNLVWVGLATGG